MRVNSNRCGAEAASETSAAQKMESGTTNDQRTKIARSERNSRTLITFRLVLSDCTRCHPSKSQSLKRGNLKQAKQLHLRAFSRAPKRGGNTVHFQNFRHPLVAVPSPPGRGLG